jgi:mitochondrial intermediate peptidase
VKRGCASGKFRIHWHSLSSIPSSADSTSGERRGLFGIAELQEPRDFGRLAHEAMRECGSIRQQLQNISEFDQSNVTSFPPQYILFLLDRISQCVCNVIDAAELGRSVHADAEWREAAQQAFAILADYITELNADALLYQMVSHVENDSLTKEDVRFRQLLQSEFERDGIHLPDEQREQVRALVNEITELESAFQHNLVHGPPTLVACDAQKVLSIVPLSVLQAHGGGKENGTVLVPVQAAAVVQTVLRLAPCATLRQQLFLAHYSTIPENLEVLEQLRKQRRRLAHMLGFSSYADRVLRPTMAQTPEQVRKFLERVALDNQDAYRREMELLLQCKQQHLREQGKGHDDLVSPGLEPWDISFYTQLYKQQHKPQSTQDASVYFAFDNTIQGMQILCDRLFGISMVETELSPLEQWDISATDMNPQVADKAISGSKSSIRRFAFYHDGGESDGARRRNLGTMYLDPFPRPGKYNHAAHFTVRCGCVTDFHQPNSFQLPIVALVCNFAASVPTGTVLLSHGEVETLFHEFGHALHSLLSRTKYQHVSGTRVRFRLFTR